MTLWFLWQLLQPAPEQSLLKDQIFNFTIRNEFLHLIVVIVILIRPVIGFLLRPLEAVQAQPGDDEGLRVPADEVAQVLKLAQLIVVALGC